MKTTSKKPIWTFKIIPVICEGSVEEYELFAWNTICGFKQKTNLGTYKTIDQANGHIDRIRSAGIVTVKVIKDKQP